MSIDEILEGLAKRYNELPVDLLCEAARRREEITPHLLRMLENPDDVLNRLYTF